MIRKEPDLFGLEEQLDVELENLIQAINEKTKKILERLQSLNRASQKGKRNEKSGKMW